MNCCQKSITEYIIKEALLMKGQNQGEQFAEQMIKGAAINMNRKEDREIIEKIGQEAIDMVNSFSN